MNENLQNTFPGHLIRRLHLQSHMCKKFWVSYFKPQASVASKVEEEAILTFKNWLASVKVIWPILFSFQPAERFSGILIILMTLELPKLSKRTLLHSAHGAWGHRAAECCSHTMDCQTCSLRTTRLLPGFVLAFEKRRNSVSSGTELEDQHCLDHLML